MEKRRGPSQVIISGAIYILTPRCKILCLGVRYQDVATPLRKTIVLNKFNSQGFIQDFRQEGANAVIVKLKGEDFIMVFLGFNTRFVREGIT